MFGSGTPRWMGLTAGGRGGGGNGHARVILGLRSLLRNKGYHVPGQGTHAGYLLRHATADYLGNYPVGFPGHNGPINHDPGIRHLGVNAHQLASALGEHLSDLTQGQSSGRHPRQFNKTYGQHGYLHAGHGPSAGEHMVPMPGHGGGGHDPAPHSRHGGGGGGGNGGGGGMGPAPQVHLNVKQPGLKLIDPTKFVGQYGGKLFNPAYADALASSQFDQQIADARQSKENLGSQRKQSLHDIEHWYGQVLDAQDTAADRDRETSQAAKHSIRGINEAVLDSLGGGANRGGGLVAAAGQNNLGTLNALGSIQDQYNHDIVPLLKSERAGASSREMARQSQLAQAAAQQIQDLMAQKGSARSQGQLQLAMANNQTRQQQLANLLGIRQYNNQQRQQVFTNKNTLKQEQIAAAMGGLDYSLKAQAQAAANKQAAAGIGLQKQQGRMASKQIQLQHRAQFDNAVKGVLHKTYNGKFPNPQVRHQVVLTMASRYGINNVKFLRNYLRGLSLGV